MLALETLEFLRIATTFVVFVFVAILDWKYREIDPRIWIAPIALGILADIYRAFSTNLSLVDVASAIMSLIIVGIMGIATFVLRAVGGADFLAIASIVALYPFPKALTFADLFLPPQVPLPPILPILLYACISVIVVLLLNVAINVARRSIAEKLDLPKSRKILYALIGRYCYLEEFLRKRFWYPLYVPGIVDRKSFDVEEDDAAWREKLKGLDPSTPMVATWGIPLVSFLSIATLIYLFLGSYPLELVLNLARW